MKKNTTLLPYGKGVIELRKTENMTIFEGKGGRPLRNPSQTLKKMLDEPIGTVPLAELARKKKAKNAVIVVSDSTRAVPNKEIVPPIIAALENAGIFSEQILILVGTGTHRPTTHEEKNELFGSEISRKYKIIDHDCCDEKNLLRFENKECDFYVNRRYMESDLKIVTGLIEPHFLAGFSGGRKGVCPGIAGMKTIRYFHSPAVLESPFARPGNLKQNPCHIFATSFAETVGVDFIVNVTINKKKQITGIFCGDMKMAFEAGVERCRTENVAYASREFDIVITTNGGYPLDRDFYQTVKGLVGTLEILKDGGSIICASECSDGLGGPNFRKLLSEMADFDSFMEMISKPNFFHPDQWEVEALIWVLRKAKVKLYSCLPDADSCLARVEPIQDIETGVKESIGQYGEKVCIGVIPDGPYTIVERVCPAA
jgi:nickel-dependent lactate racemase